MGKGVLEILGAALGLFQLKPEEALHVGDSPDTDAAGANGAGLRGVLLDRGGNAASNSFQRVRNLKEILSLINNPS